MDSLLEAADRALSLIGDNWDAGQAESADVDFKETPDTTNGGVPGARKNFREMLAETAVCFANGEGGAIVVGVKNRAPTAEAAIAGVPSAYEIEELVRSIFENTAPAITVRPQVREIAGKRVFILVVPKGVGVHSTRKGVYKIRLHDRCLPLAGDQLKGLRALRENYDWTAEPSGMGLESLSLAALERGAMLLRRWGHDDLADRAEADTEAFLQATGLLRDGQITRAAILLYGRPDALRRVSPGWGVTLQTRESPGGEPTILIRHTEQHSEQPLVILLESLIAAVRVLAKVNTIRVGAVQVELVDYPPDALREVIANAFVHRDWEAPGVVEVIHTPDELVVTSPGGLLPTLRVDRLLHDASAPRNRLLAENMSRLRLAEMAGLGLDRAFREIARLGKEPPILEDGPRFRVTLPGGRGDEAFARFLNGPGFPANLSGDLDVLMVLTALRHTKSMNANALSSRLQRNVSDVDRTLRRMGEVDLVQPTKGTARNQFPSYTLTPSAVAGMRAAISYRVDRIDAEDNKLIRHLERHGRISNEDVRNYLDCDIATARNRLTRLRRKGLIDFAPDSPRRGAKVVYVRSATFPGETTVPS
ncbi:RNA-binding domain-containing protein [Herbidospora yilanensis]|uniref:RNA-binding domain-containing protein n=1 Tax=Herbidospora yilanensis TaxID=354426 RepID=UPI000780825A|nr:RNA-binding domain-containing protein [Herbidospora yilanensis]